MSDLKKNVMAKIKKWLNYDNSYARKEFKKFRNQYIFLPEKRILTLKQFLPCCI